MDYYSVLEVDKTATRDDIRAAFKRLILAHHPDRAAINSNRGGGGGGGGSADFASIKEAYELLMDDDKRYVLDRWGDVGLFIYTLFEQQSKQQNDDYDAAANTKSPKDCNEDKEKGGPAGRTPHKEDGRIRDQIDALLAWHGIRLHSLLVGLAVLSLALFTIAWGFRVMAASQGYFLVFSNAVTQSVVLVQSRRDALSLAVLLVLFGLFDAWQYLLWCKVNFLCTVLPPVVLIQLIGALVMGVRAWHQPLAVSLSTVLLCLRWNGFLVLPYSAVLLPVLLSRVASAKAGGSDRNNGIIVALALYTVCSVFMHLPHWAASMPVTLALVVVGLFLSVAVPLGHYFIIRLIIEHLKERKPHVAGYIK